LVSLFLIEYLHYGIYLADVFNVTARILIAICGNEVMIMHKYLIATIFVICLSCTLHAAEKKSFFEGYDLLQKGYMEKAIPFFEQAIKEDPAHAPSYSKLAECYEKLGNYDKAAPLWDKYIELSPKLAEKMRNHVELLKKLVEADELG